MKSPEQYQPSKKEIKKSEKMMTEEERHDSSIREKAVDIGEAYFKDFTEERNPDITQKIENDYVKKCLNDFRNQFEILKESFKKNLEGKIEEAERNEDIDRFLADVTKQTEDFFTMLQETYKRICDDRVKLYGTVSDFVILRKKILLQQETDKKRKKEIADSILKSEAAKKSRIGSVEAGTTLEAYEKLKKGMLEELEEIKREYKDKFSPI